MKHKLAVLMVTAFIDMVGLLMLMPILPFYAKEMGGGGLVVGLLVSSFAVAQLISAPMWGRFSDRYGRKPLLLAGPQDGRGRGLGGGHRDRQQCDHLANAIGRELHRGAGVDSPRSGARHGDVATRLWPLVGR